MKVSAAVSEPNPQLDKIQAPIPIDRQWISKLLQKYPNPNARCNDKALVVAPMVDQSELPFRLLCLSFRFSSLFSPRQAFLFRIAVFASFFRLTKSKSKQQQLTTNQHKTPQHEVH